MISRHSALGFLLSGIFLAGTAAAQSNTQFNAMLSLPTGDFGAKSGNNAGLATTGFGLALEHCAAFDGGPLGWVTGASFILNFNGMEDALHDAGAPSDVTADGGTYLNVPIMTGLRATGPAGPTVKVYGQFQLGMDFLNVTDLTVSEGSSNGGSVSFDPSFSFCFGAGVGIMFSDRVNAGLRFFHSPERDIDVSNSLGQSGTGNLSVSMIQLVLGTVF
jgi:hypothetical protein